MPEKSDQEVIADYENSLKDMRRYGGLSAFGRSTASTLEIQFGQVLGEVIKRQLLPEASEVYERALPTARVFTHMDEMRFVADFFRKK